MQNEANHLAISGRCPQLFAGPTEPKAGPILPIELAEAANAVSISRPNIANIIAVKTKIKI